MRHVRENETKTRDSLCMIKHLPACIMGRRFTFFVLSDTCFQYSPFSFVIAILASAYLDFCRFSLPPRIQQTLHDYKAWTANNFLSEGSVAFREVSFVPAFWEDQKGWPHGYCFQYAGRVHSIAVSLFVMSFLAIILLLAMTFRNCKTSAPAERSFDRDLVWSRIMGSRHASTQPGRNASWISAERRNDKNTDGICDDLIGCSSNKLRLGLW